MLEAECVLPSVEALEFSHEMAIEKSIVEGDLVRKLEEIPSKA